MPKRKIIAHKKSVMREMIAIALPMVISQGCDTVMIFTDRLFLSRLGPELMNASMGGGLTAFVMLTFFIGLIGYTTALAAQYLGAGFKNKCAVVVTQAVLIAFIAYPLILICRPLAYLFFDKMGVDSAQLVLQKVYFNILISAAILNLFRCSLSCFFSGIGRTRVVMSASFVSMTVNIFFNYVLIYGKLGFPALGIRGAAYGTIIGSFGGFLVLLWAYLNKNNRVEFQIKQSFRIDWEVIKKLLRFGTPSGVEMFLNLLAFNLMIMTFHSHSRVTATAATIMFNWDLVAFVPLIGIEIGVTSLVGRYMGARDPDKAHMATMAAMKMGFIYSAIIFVLFALFPEHLVNFFRPNVPGLIYAQAEKLAVFMLRIASFYVLVDAMIVAIVGALRGAGDTMWAMWMTVVLHWLVAGVAFMMMKVLRLSPQAGWTAVVSVFFVFSFLIYWRYHSGQWKSISVISPEPEMLSGDVFHESL
ncbi:MAG: MATE family efflux transporter [Candidatus Omnitrophota bacterium]